MAHELFLLAVFIVNLFFGQPNNAINENLITVTRVIDGDTIEIASEEKVRLIGVNSPESKDCFGEEATAFTNEYLLNKSVKLEKDVSETDKYGRLLRYVHIGGVLFNEQLVKNGYAQVSTFPPDVKYKDKFLTAQNLARNNNAGLWDKCK